MRKAFEFLLLLLLPFAGAFSFHDDFIYAGNESAFKLNWSEVNFTQITVAGLAGSARLTNNNNVAVEYGYIVMNRSNQNQFGDFTASYGIRQGITTYGQASGPFAIEPYQGFFFRASSLAANNGLPYSGYSIALVRFGGDMRLKIVKVVNGVNTTLNTTVPTLLNLTTPAATGPELNLTVRAYGPVIEVWNTSLINDNGAKALLLWANDSTFTGGLAGFGHSYGWNGVKNDNLADRVYANFTFDTGENVLVNVNQSEKMGDTSLHIIKGIAQNSGGLLDALLKPEYLFALAVILGLYGLSLSMKSGISFK